MRVVSKIAHSSEARLDEDCPGPVCPIAAERGDVHLGPSFHPAVAAIVLEATSQVAITLETRRRADGSQVTGIVRCEPGGSLVLLGDSDTPIRVPVPTERDWSRLEMFVRVPTTEISSIDWIGVETPTILRFANEGSAPCLLARVRYETLENVCGAYRCESELDARTTTDAALDRPTTRFDAQEYDVPEILDASTDASPDAATEDTTDRDASFDAANDAVETDTRESPDSADGV